MCGTTMGFADTAAFFEARARKARDPDDQRRLQDVAGFYRSLAGIASGFPPGFKGDGAARSHANRWKARAEECRTMADHFQDPQCCEQLARLAETYERLAEAAE
jgi:hypothetical protein